MEIWKHVYAVALRAYPAEFRKEHQEDVLATLADMSEAGERRRHVRQLASLVFNGNRQRWLRSTGGSLSATIRQGLAWGLLVLIARQAGLAAVDVFRPMVHGWTNPSLVSDGLLLVGWVAAFCLLAAGARRWGLALLGAVTAGYVYHRVTFALGYGGRFDLPWTLHFFLPTVLPMVLACLWPRKGVKLPVWWWPPLLVAAGAIPLLSTAPWGAWRFSEAATIGVSPSETVVLSHGTPTAFWVYCAAWYLAGIILVALLFAVAASDPRWALAAWPVFAVFGGQHLVSAMAGSQSLDNLLYIVGLLLVAPAVFLLFARRVRRRVSI